MILALNKGGKEVKKVSAVRSDFRKLFQFLAACLCFLLVVTVDRSDFLKSLSVFFVQDADTFAKFPFVRGSINTCRSLPVLTYHGIVCFPNGEF